ncbi:MAG: glycine cleavage system aminomethyltransferase GcvT [Actinobacteria bacterium]|nr:glycine cleavage system aminomethyltransferase GcvT [Actinomycetota bacterium]
MTEIDGPLRQSPLDAEHRALGARMVPFGGWDMPIQYESVLAEHRACRERAVVFDVSHLGSVRVHGSGARPLLQWALTNDLGRIEPGKAQYTHLLDPDDAHVVDDIIVWWVADDDFLVMPNASNTGPLVAALEDAVSDPADGAACRVEDVTATRAVLAVQGPEARALIEPLARALAAVPRFAVRPAAYDGHEGFVAGTGYTGEDGIELHIPAPAAPAWWRKLIGAGLVPAGLGARDTLRLEAGLPLHGHELGPGITPLQAGLAWVVRFDKGAFRGRTPLLAEREQGVHRKLHGLLVDGRQVPRSGQAVLRGDGDDVIGEVTSGNFSPVLERGIALAFLHPDIEEGAEVAVDVRGRRAAARVVRPPFVRRDG